MRTIFLQTQTASQRSDSVVKASDALRQGKLVAFPTETVYGLGANALDERAVREIFRVKGRPEDNPLIVHVHSRKQATELMQDVPPLFTELANEFWPGPLTMVVPRNAAVPDIVTAGLSSVALRMPDHQLTREFLRAAAVPVAAPSANISGRPSPTSGLDVYHDLKGLIFAVLDGGSCDVGIESTVLDLTTDLPTILRPGTVTREDLEDVIQSRVYFATDIPDRPAAPGMKYKHYAPEAELVVIRSEHPDAEGTLKRRMLQAQRTGKRTALLAPERFDSTGADLRFSLGEGAAVDYARMMYAGLRALDAGGADIIFCPGIPEEGIGYAVMNRLGKAASKVIR
ncbi:MAG: L-threonylcarbamoyladenylate synthase [Bacteroidia bacterium]|nr:L-threonylcarbamoyladenylate synthase [Bacteroidia bacterium]